MPSRTPMNQPTGLCFHLFAMIQTGTYLYSSNFTPQGKEARNQSQIFNRKSISRNTTHRQSYHLQAMPTGEIVILNYEDHDTIMTRELQQFEKLDVSAKGWDIYLEKLRKDCNDVMVKLHNLGAVNDELLLHVTGTKCKSNSHRKVYSASAKFFLLQYTRLPAFQNT